MPISIRTRLAATFTLAIVCVLLVGNLALSGFSRRLAAQRTERVLHEADKAAAHSIDEEWDEYCEDFPSRVGAGEDHFDSAEPVRTAIEHTRQELSEDHVDIVVIDNGTGKVIRSDTAGSGLPWPLKDSDGWRVSRTDLRHTRAGSFSIVVGIPWYEITARLKTQDLQVAELCLFFVCLFGVATWILVGYTLRPIGILAEQARAFRDAPASRRVQLTAPSPDSEVVILVRTLNSLLDGIAAGAEAKGRFYTAASHELRTPLHVLSGQVELTLSRPRTAEEYSAAMVEVQSQTDRLKTIIESLLLLNRLDRGTREAPSGGVIVESICEEQLRMVRPTIESRGLTVVSVSPEPGEACPALVNAPEMHVEILLRNLIENAAKYALPGTEIRTTVSHLLPYAAVFSIHNRTAGIEPGDFSRLSEPFYRPDASRSAQTGGNGLGLSICRALAEANGWKLSLRQELGGMTATVNFGESRA